MASTDISTATAAPIEIDACGKTWKFAPINLKGFGELEQWARSKIISLGREQVVNLHGDEAARLCIMKAAFDKASRICFMAASKPSGDHFAQALRILVNTLPKDEESGKLNKVVQQAADMLAQAVTIASSTEDAMDAQAVLSSIDGVIRICQISLRKHHGDVSEDVVESILEDEKVDGNMLASEVMRISGQSTFRSASR